MKKQHPSKNQMQHAVAATLFGVLLSVVALLGTGCDGSQTPNPSPSQSSTSSGDGNGTSTPSPTASPTLWVQLSPAADLSSFTDLVDNGPMPGDQSEYFDISLLMNTANENAYSNQQYDPSSPLFHQWLTPDELCADFGLPANLIANVTRYVQSFGMLIAQNDGGCMLVSVYGTASQIEAAFNTQLELYTTGGVEASANNAPIYIPNTLLFEIVSISLDNVGAGGFSGGGSGGPGGNSSVSSQLLGSSGSSQQ